MSASRRILGGDGHAKVVTETVREAEGYDLCGILDGDLSRHDKAVRGVEIGEGTQLGIRSSVSAGCKVGAWSIIAARAVVIDDILANSVATGVPARPVRLIEEKKTSKR